MTGSSMTRLAVDSTTLAWVAYDEGSRRLDIQFRDGVRYAYLAVPGHLFRALLAAHSKGQFFNRSIRRAFSYVKLS